VTERSEADVIILDHPGCDAYEEGHYLVFLEPDGTAWDCIGPFDSEREARHILEENFGA
jgi:hypothetical protein